MKFAIFDQSGFIVAKYKSLSQLRAALSMICRVTDGTPSVIILANERIFHNIEGFQHFDKMRYQTLPPPQKLMEE